MALKNLILGTAIGYGWNDISIFVKSLRNYFKGDVFLLVNPINDEKLIKKLEFYKINFIECNLLKKNFRFRYCYFFNFLKKKFLLYKFVMFTDVRDVFFQSNPFLKKYKNPINFYSEEEIVKNCKINSLWINLTLGEKKFEKYKNNYIVCSGTVIGKSLYMLKYFNMMAKKINNLRMKFSIKNFFLRRLIKYGIDQPACHDIVYSSFFNNQKIFSNKFGNVATVGHMKKFTFDKNNKLINFNKKNYDVIHQYDRRFSLFKKTIKNCIS